MADYQAEARRAAERYGLDPNIFVRQIRQESGFNPNVVSGAGAIGIAQIMPATAKGWGVDPHDPIASLNAAAKNMASYVKKYGSYRDALVAYNAGPGRVGKPLFAETANYVKTILGGSNPTGLGQATGSADSSSVASAPGAPQLLSSGQAGDFTGILAALLKPQGQQQAGPPSSSLGASPFAAAPAMPKGFAPAPIIASPTPQTGSNVSQALSLVEALGGTGPTVGSPGGSGGAESPGIADQVATQRQAGSGFAGMVPLGGSKNAGQGSFQISGPNPKRLRPELVKFADQVAEVLGAPLVGLDGSTHSKFTVNGNVSEHYTGNATDVFTIGGLKYGDKGWQQELIRAGRAALIAAGMPRAKALKQTGGLFNVGNHQIIFNASGNAVGGNHLDHLHISTHAH